MLKRVFTLLLLQLCLTAQAGNLKIVGRVTDAVGAISIQLWAFDNSQQTLLTTLYTQADGSFTFQKDLTQPTLFALQVNGGQKVEFLVGTNDNVVTLKATMADLLHGYADFKPYSELQAYQQWQQYLGGYSQQSDDTQKDLREVSPLRPDYTAEKQRLEVKLDSLAYNFDKQLQQIRVQFPNTYTAQVLVPLAWMQYRKLSAPLDIYDTQYAFQHDHYWDSVPFADQDLIRHPFLKQKLVYYMNNYVPNNSPGIKSAIDRIFGHRNMADSVFNYFNSYFLDKLSQKEYPELIKYLNGEFGRGNTASNTNYNQVMQKANRLQIGAALDSDIVLKDTKGNLLSLREIASKNKYTILYFWQPDCEHCQAFNQLLAEKKQTLAKNGIGIYAFCLTNSPAVFSNSEKNENITWPNVSDLLGYTSPLIAAYNVHFTPQIYILDRHLKILDKDMPGEEVITRLEKL